MIDIELGLVYVNSGNPSPDYDGSARPGMNLFTNATIALELETGRLAWYYQTVHHDLWDWDHVTGPLLFDATKDGQTIKGVAAAGKNCLMYMWHRETASRSTRWSRRLYRPRPMYQASRCGQPSRFRTTRVGSLWIRFVRPIPS